MYMNTRWQLTLILNLYRVLTSEVLQNTRFQNTYTPIIRATGYIVSTLINTDLIDSCSMLKKQKQFKPQAPFWRGPTGTGTSVKKSWAKFLQHWHATSNEKQSLKNMGKSDKSSQIHVLLWDPSLSKNNVQALCLVWQSYRSKYWKLKVSESGGNCIKLLPP